MRIKEIIVDNYRNLSGVIIEFNNKFNSIVGDNGIGKTSIVELIDTIFNRNSFKDSDFFDIDKKIEVVITLVLDECEIGYFDDLFEPENPMEIKIVISQEKVDGRIEYKHLLTGTVINYSKIKNIPCVYYNSVSSPSEVDFSKGKNVGKFLNYIMENYINKNDITPNDIIKIDKLFEITSYMDRYLDNIEIMRNSMITSQIDNNALELLPKLLGLKNNNNISINQMGSGIRYSVFTFFEILNCIVNSTKNNKSIIITTNDGKKVLPIIVLLDEPEIHLHPFMQRKIIKQIKRIVDNEDNDFKKLLKELFDIDLLIGQVIIVTHSNEIMTNDYREYIRMYKKDNSILSISGNEILLDKEEEKHILRLGSYIKEAFFAKVVLIYEGISEKGCIDSFAQKIGIDLNESNIGVLSADGEGNVRKLKEICEQFKIMTVCVLDKDVYSEKDKENGLLCTDDQDLELDIVNNLIKNHATKKTIKIIREYEKKSIKDVILQKEQIKKSLKKTGDLIEIKNYSIKDALKSRDNSIIKNVLYTWFVYRKDMIRGRIVGEILDVEDIPSIYVLSIRKAKEIADEL